MARILPATLVSHRSKTFAPHLERLIGTGRDAVMQSNFHEIHMNDTRLPDTQRRTLLLAVPSAAALAACGGGGGGGNITTPTSPQLSVLAGSVGGFGDLDGPASINRLNAPGAVVVDAQGVIYIADTENHVIRMLDRSGILSTIAGKPGSSGSADGRGAEARFFSPRGIALDGAGGLFVADSLNHTIRRVSVEGHVATVAGLAGVPGLPVPFGQVQSAEAARFDTPHGLAFDGKTLYIADSGNHAIRQLSEDGQVFMLAGAHDGSFGVDVPTVLRAQARFNTPTALGLHPIDATAGVLWVADTLNGAIRKFPLNGTAVFTSATPGAFPVANVQPLAIAIDPISGDALVLGRNAGLMRVGAQLTAATVQVISDTSVGSADGPVATASFDTQSSGSGAIGHDALVGRFIVADAGNNLLRSVVFTEKTGAVGTLAGQRKAQGGQVNGPGSQARFATPISLAPEQDGSVLVGEGLFTGQAGMVRRVSASGGVSQVLDTKADFGILPHLVGVAANGDIYVADAKNVVIARNGAPALLLKPPSQLPIQDGPAGVGSFGSITSLVVDAVGRGIFADSGGHAVRILTPAGVLSRLAGQYGERGLREGDALEEALLDMPVDLAIASDGSIYVLDNANRVVLRIADGSNGRKQVHITAGGFQNPRALAVDTQLNLYVAEATANTIVRVQPSGARKTVAGLPERRGFVSGAMPGALALAEELDITKGVGMRIVSDRLLITMEQAVVQISPLPT
jgi:sugar lactone lactonase YvrE